METVKSIIDQITVLANVKRKAMYLKQGVKEEIIGVNLGDLRKLADRIKVNHALALELWNTNIYEARVVACMIFESLMLDENTIEQLILSTDSGPVIDEFSFQIFDDLSNQLELYDKWIKERNHKLKRAAWNMAIVMNHDNKLTDDKIRDILNYIEANLADANEMFQFAMNRCLCEIGIRHDSFTQQCISIGENLAVYKEMKVSKGCTSAYAPIWINVVRNKYNKR